MDQNNNLLMRKLLIVVSRKKILMYFFGNVLKTPSSKIMQELLKLLNVPKNVKVDATPIPIATVDWKPVNAKLDLQDLTVRLIFALMLPVGNTELAPLAILEEKYLLLTKLVSARIPGLENDATVIRVLKWELIALEMGFVWLLMRTMQCASAKKDILVLYAKKNLDVKDFAKVGVLLTLVAHLIFQTRLPSVVLNQAVVAILIMVKITRMMSSAYISHTMTTSF